MAWAPGDPWPGTPGGAASPHWGDALRLYIWAAIYEGTPMRWGPVAGDSDRLDAGNTYTELVPGATPVPPSPPPPAERLWIDLSCSVIDLDTHLGGTRAEGALAQAEAATLTLTLADPDRIYDPLNPESPFQYQGRSRLAPGAQVVVFVETIIDPDTSTITRHMLFTGTVESWSEPWEPKPVNRRASVIASDATKQLVAMDRGAQTPVGEGDSTAERITRVLDHYGWVGERAFDESSTFEAATDLGASAWALIQKATDDEVGFIHFDASGVLQFWNRSTWTEVREPVLTVGCSSDVPDAADIVTAATVVSADLSVTNAVYAGRTGGTVQVARSESSIALFGEHGLKRTDLGVLDDAEAARWATFVLSVRGWPRAHIDAITLHPNLDPDTWPAVLDTRLAIDQVRVVWSPPDSTVTYDTQGNVFGIGHTITHTSWEVTWSLALADVFARVLRWGPAELDRLTVGNVYR